MGQAKNRGTYEERLAARKVAQEELAAQREREDMEQQRIISEKWSKMSQEERDLRLKKAQEEMAFMSFINQFH